MKKKILYILAPNDRFNYGDLLFPYIIRHYIGHEFDNIRYVSTSTSDLSNIGGIPTESFQVLYEANDEVNLNYLIVAGGESLFASWGIIMSFVNSKYFSYKSFLEKTFFFKKSIGIRLYNSCISSLPSIKTKYPFTIGKNELLNFKGIYYNSVGGVGLDSSFGKKLLHKKVELNILSSVDYIAVRDKYTNRALTAANINNTLAADCAIMMADIFTKEILEGKLSINKTTIDTPYIFFQGNKLYLENNADKIAKELLKLQKETGYKICLCPIGIALGHEDIEGFKYLIPKLELYGVPYMLIMSPNLFDIMWLIKSSKLYIGTSLHGIITSMSFSVPYIGYCKKKLMTYINTWGNKDYFADSINSIYLTAFKALQTPVDINKSNIQKESVLKSLHYISNLIKQH